MGGQGTWNILMNHPDIFAAAVPICGAADSTKADRLKDIPIYTCHGSEDSVVPVSATRLMVDALKKTGNKNVKYVEMPGVGHDVWTQFTARKSVIEWLFSHTKNAG